MPYSMSKHLADKDVDHLIDLKLPPVSTATPLMLHYPRWKIKALLIEALIIIFSFVSVVIYNYLFNAQISPVLGVIVGAVNGSLVVWCITHADLSPKIAERKKNRSRRYEPR